MTDQPTPPMALSFERDVRPLFREKDRSSMLKHFDLWSYSDVRENQDAILDKIREGRMPCDGPGRLNASLSCRAGSPPDRHLERDLVGAAGRKPSAFAQRQCRHCWTLRRSLRLLTCGWRSPGRGRSQ
jgi:hypothetical protein